MSNLPGLSNDRQFTADIELLVLFYKSLRAFYICLFYLTNKKLREAIAFSFKVDTYLKQVESDLTPAAKKSTELDKSRLEEMKSELVKLKDDLAQLKYKMQTSSILDEASGGDEDDDKNAQVSRDKLEKIPLTERMDIYFEDNNLLNNQPNLVRIPGTYEPIGCKPLFFDLALNHIELPSLEDKIDSKKPGQKDSGMKGLIKGIFGFR